MHRDLLLCSLSATRQQSAVTCICAQHRDVVHVQKAWLQPDCAVWQPVGLGMDAGSLGHSRAAPGRTRQLSQVCRHPWVVDLVGLVQGIEDEAHARHRILRQQSDKRNPVLDEGAVLDLHAHQPSTSLPHGIQHRGSQSHLLLHEAWQGSPEPRVGASTSRGESSHACVASREEEAHPQQGVRKGLGSGDDIEACVVAEPCQQLAAAPTVTRPAMLCLKGRYSQRIIQPGPANNHPDASWSAYHQSSAA